MAYSHHIRMYFEQVPHPPLSSFIANLINRTDHDQPLLKKHWIELASNANEE